MKLTISRANLLALLTTCATVAKPKSTNGALECALLRADVKTGLHGSASDLYQEIVTSAPADVAKAGETMVNVRDIMTRVKSFPEAVITMTLAGDNLKVESGKRKHNVPCRNVSDFPEVPAMPSGAIEVPAETLRALFRKTSYAMFDSPDRPMIHGTHVEREAGRLTFVASDGVRMPCVSAAAPESVAAPPLLLAYEAVGSLCDVIPADGSVRIVADAIRVWFDTGSTVFSCKLVAEKFPPYRQIMGTTPADNFRVQRLDFMDSLRSVEKSCSATDAKKGLVRLNLSAGKLKMSASGNGEAEDEIDAIYSGPGIEVGMYVHQIVDALTAIDAETVRIHFSDSLNAMMVRPDIDDESETHMVLPAQLPKADAKR